MNGQSEIIAGLDVGTTKVCVVVGEMSGDEINIIGTGIHPSTGLRKGVVVNIESTVKAIKKAVQDAELMAGCEISSVYTGIAGAHISGMNSHGIVSIQGTEITKNDVARVIDAASAVSIAMDRKVIHVLDQEYIVDGQSGIYNPVGMSGINMEVKVHIVTASVTAVNNIEKCANKAGLDVCGIVLEPLASGEAVLTSEEKELGSILIDLGGGTTDLAIFSRKNINHTFILGLGGSNLTNDIAIGIRTSIEEAEKIKTKYGAYYPGRISGDEIIEIHGTEGQKPRKLSRQILGEILQPRMEEIFALINREIYNAGIEDAITSGVVVTGGGALLETLSEIAEFVFQQPVRLGRPQGVGGLVDVVSNPIYATGVGLVLFGAKNQTKKKFTAGDSKTVSRIIKTIKKWFKDIL